MSRNDEAKLFVGSMPLGTTEEGVREVFGPFGTIEEVYMMDSRRGGMQCCFVKFSAVTEAQAALVATNGKADVIGTGTTLEVRFSESKRKRAEEAAASYGMPPEEPKLFVGNLPTTVEKTELETVFSPYGELTDVVILEKGGRANKCGFVIFKKMADAVSAVAGLNGLHTFSGGAEPVVVRVADSGKKRKMEQQQQMMMQQQMMGMGGMGMGMGGMGGMQGMQGMWGGGGGMGMQGGMGGYGGGGMGGKGGAAGAAGGYGGGAAGAGYGGGAAAGAGAWGAAATGGGYGGGYGGAAAGGMGGYGGASRGSEDAGKAANKLFVGNLPESVSDQMLREAFQGYGALTDVYVMKSKGNRPGQACGFVKFGSLQECENAIGQLNQKFVMPGGLEPIIVRYANTGR